MASKLQSLLGVAPLENLRKRKPQNQYGMSGQNMFGMDTPINTDFQQIGNQPLAPIRTQAPVQQNYFNTQMNNMGLQNPYSMSFGPDDVDPEGGDEEQQPRQVMYQKEEMFHKLVCNDLELTHKL